MRGRSLHSERDALAQASLGEPGPGAGISFDQVLRDAEGKDGCRNEEVDLVATSTGELSVVSLNETAHPSGDRAGPRPQIASMIALKVALGRMALSVFAGSGR